MLADLTIELVPPRDWVRENQQSFPPLRYNYLAPISLNVASIQTRSEIIEKTGVEAVT